jgi:hypothetical protein
MKKAFDEYTLLAGGSGLSGSLWKGPDHLLVIEATGFLLPYREVYRRIDYKNIQALTLTETRGYIWKALLVTIPLLIALAGAISVGSSGKYPGAVWGLIAACIALSGILVVHFSQGRTCVCSLQTAVLPLRLQPLKRKRKASAILEDLAELCRQHQGAMPPMTEMPAAPAPTPFGYKPEWLGSVLVRNTMILAIIWGAMFMSELFVPSMAYFIAGALILIALFFMVIPSLVTVSRARVAGSLVGSLWCLLLTTILAAIDYFGIFIASAVALEGPGKSATPAENLQWMATLTFSQAQSGAWFIIGTGALALFLGLLGLPSTFKRQTLAPQPHQAPPSGASQA